MSTLPDSDLSSLPVPVSRHSLLQRAIEVAVSVGFLALALRGIHFGDLLDALRGANYLWLLPAVITGVVMLVLKAWRWQWLFYPEHRLPLRPVFTALCAGYLASNVLPARLGEVVRLVLLVSEQPVSVARTFSTIVVERLLDVLTLIVVLVALLPFVQLPSEMTRAAQMLGMLALAGVALMVLLSFWKERLLRWTHLLFSKLRFLDRPVAYSALGHLIDGFATLRGRLGAGLFGVSLLGWIGVTGMAWCAAQAFPLPVPVTAIVFAVVVTALGMLVPSSPGYIGVFHYLATVALAPFGVPKDLALSYALVWHAVNYLTLSGAGAVALWVHGTSLGQVLRRWRGRDRVTG